MMVASHHSPGTGVSNVGKGTANSRIYSGPTRTPQTLEDDTFRRVVTRKVQTAMCADQLNVYLRAVDLAFKGSIDYAMLHKVYAGVQDGKYSPAECIGTKQIVVTGDPNPQHISTSFVERSNLTMRMHMRRFTRLTDAFSKKFANHAHMVAIYTVWYNFVRIHKTLRVNPAMEANLTDRVWTMFELVDLMERVSEPEVQSK